MRLFKLLAIAGFGGLVVFLSIHGQDLVQAAKAIPDSDGAPVIYRNGWRLRWNEQRPGDFITQLDGNRWVVTGGAGCETGPIMGSHDRVLGRYIKYRVDTTTGPVEFQGPSTLVPPQGWDETNRDYDLRTRVKLETKAAD